MNAADILTPEEREALAQMFRNLALAGVVGFCSCAHGDQWTGKDKAGHAQAGALIGSLSAAASKSPAVGCLIAVGAGVAKEAYDTQHPQTHTVSFKDAAVTAAFGCLAAKVSGVFIGPGFIGVKGEF